MRKQHAQTLKTSRWRKEGLSLFNRFAKRKEGFLLFILTAVAGFLRFYRLGAESFWRDELIQVTLAQEADSLWETAILSSANQGSAPLDYMITHWMLDIGRTEAILRVPAALFGVGTVLLLYFVGKKLFTPASGFLAAMLLSLTQLHIYYSQELRFYSLATFLILLSFYLFIQVISTDRMWLWIGLTIVSTLALYSHYYMVFLIMALGLWTLIRRRELLNRLIVSLGVSVVLFFPWIYLDIIRVGSINPRPFEFQISTVIPKVLGGLTIGQNAPCMVPCLPVPWRATLIVAVLLLGLLALYRSRGRTRDSILLLLLILLVGIPGILLLDYIGEHYFSVRQIVVWVPYFMLIIGSLLILVPERLAPYVVLSSILIFAAISTPSLRDMYAKQTKEDFRGAASFLKENMSPGDILFVKKPVHLTYYIPELKNFLYTGPQTRAKIRATLIALNDNGNNAWFVLWGKNPRAYEQGWKGIRRRGDKVFPRPRVIKIPPANRG